MSTHGRPRFRRGMRAFFSAAQFCAQCSSAAHWLAALELDGTAELELQAVDQLQRECAGPVAGTIDARADDAIAVDEPSLGKEPGAEQTAYFVAARIDQHLE